MKRILSLKTVLWCLAIVAVATVTVQGWATLYATYLEGSAPVISFPDGEPRGIGVAPLTVKLHLKDWGAGLDEVVVRIHQRNVSKELLRKPLDGKAEAQIALELVGDKLGLEEGTVQLEIKTFDRSFWSNASQRTLDLRVDYRKPRLEVLSAMHNTRRGGAQLLLYRAVDESLAISGVRVGNRVFTGFPAAGLDKDFEDKNIYAVLYAIPADEIGEPPIRIFGQDTVGNGASISFPYRVLSRPERNVTVSVSDDFLRGVVSELADRSFGRVEQHEKALGKSFGYHSDAASDERLIEKFALVSNNLRALSDEDLTAATLRSPRQERLWQGSFLQENGAVNLSFGDQVTFKRDGNAIGSAAQAGYELVMSRSDSRVAAVADGVVSFSGDFGFYGRAVGIDHGFGLVTVYGRLDSVSVHAGQTVAAGDEIGMAGRSGFARMPQLYFETRIQGVPVDPREWWDRSWYAGHIADQIEQVKRSLGLLMVKPIQ